MKTAIFLYEIVQVKELTSLLRKLESSETYDVIACGADIEFLLEQRKISYVSARAFRTVPTVERLILAKQLGSDLFHEQWLNFFMYRGIHIGKLFIPSVQYYLIFFLYSLDLVASALKNSSYTRVLTFAPAAKVGPLARVFDTLSNRAYPDALQLVCGELSISLEVISMPELRTSFVTALKARMFTFKRVVFGIAISILNRYVCILVSKKNIRIIASELWKNISPLMHELPDSELILLDRAESVVIGWTGIIRNRMQFVHSNDFVTNAQYRVEREKITDFKQNWQTIQSRQHLVQETVFVGYSLTRILNSAIEHFINASERVLREIDGTFAMIEDLNPNVVMVRAGVSAQTHFAVLCEVARLHDIPSIEVQHGILSAFEGDFTNNPPSEYIAEYGPIVREELQKHNFAPRSTFIDVGSPRFDIYTKEQKTRESTVDSVFNILHIGPQLTPGEWNDSYDVIDYFKTMASAVEHIQNVHVTIKLRASHFAEGFYREAIARAYKDIPYTVALFDPLVDLFPKADVVVSCHSTAFLEAMLAGKPVIIDATLPIYAALAQADLQRYEQAGALVIAKNQNELTNILKKLAQSPEDRRTFSARALQFMRENYLLNDGRSSERLAQTIRLLAKKEDLTQ